MVLGAVYLLNSAALPSHTRHVMICPVDHSISACFSPQDSHVQPQPVAPCGGTEVVATHRTAVGLQRPAGQQLPRSPAEEHPEQRWHGGVDCPQAHHLTQHCFGHCESKAARSLVRKRSRDSDSPPCTAEQSEETAFPTEAFPKPLHRSPGPFSVSLSFTESQNGRGWKGPLGVI